MDRMFLEDFEASEREKWEKFQDKFRDGKVKSGERYPSPSDLALKEPYSCNILHTRIWNQLPLYGTLILNLEPTSNKKDFEKLNGFDVEDIDRLIDFSKDTGRIAFCLNKLPKFYEKLDFLEPIFRELKPPVICTLRSQHVLNNEKRSEWWKEIQYIVLISKLPQILKKVMEFRGIGFLRVEYLTSFSDSYCMLRVLGYDSLADELILRVSSDPLGALQISDGLEAFLLSSYRNILGDISSVERDWGESHKNLLRKAFPEMKFQSKIEFPNEVGKFLADKLKLIIPKNMDGSIELCDEYETNDLRNVMNALNTAVKNEQPDLVNDKIIAIYELFNNVWDEANRFRNNVNFLRHGLSFGVAVVGAIATMPIGGVGGLLAGVGFEVVEEIFDNTVSSFFSENILNLKSSSHMMHIYDFNKKYKIN